MGKNDVTTKQIIQPENSINSSYFGFESLFNQLSFTGSNNISTETLTKMYQDSDIEGFINLKSNLHASMVQGYENSNKEIEKFVWDTLQNVEGSFSMTLSDALSDCTVYGHHFAEIVWQKKNNKYVIKRYVYINPLERIVELNSKLDIRCLKHSNGDIPFNKLLYLNFRPSHGIFGKSEIASLYPFFLLARTSLYNFGKTLERFGAPWAIGKSIDTESMLLMLRNMYNIASAAIATDEDISLIEPKNSGEIFDKGIDIALSAYLRKLGIPQLLVNVKNNGTYNLGEVQFSWFIDENETTSRIHQDVLLDAFVKPIIKINFGEQEDYGKFVIAKTANAETMRQYASILQILSQGNSLNDNVRYNVYEKMGVLKKDVGANFEKIYAKGGETDGKNSSDGTKNTEN
jgi:hypothetical protein